ncbi:EF-hand calcium-binding domain-containing protein 7-like isoform X3 [Crassostrea angulata]|uniref:EF-hand calcium-binding domain-containing protein 7-like isoform X3 n=1 Tax=Magallana angulata TaxID=2784310 RepID=UPI0022B19C0E|nr:EF-hand calcium-binding domain-containing protein 7-like isoform X3 [Crassostrea angulata]
MSRRSSRVSMTGDNGEFYLECKAAYLSIYDSVKDEIDSVEDLVQVLQQAGRNPSKKVLARYWKSDTEHLTFDEFVDICKKEKATTADDLMKAFRKIDINGDGYISLEELYKIMTTKGEKMSRSDVKKMIDEVDENKDGRLDYGEFCKMIMETTEECKKVSRKIMEKKELKRRKEDQTKTSDSRSGSQVSVRSAASVKSYSERPMSASSRSNKGASLAGSRKSLLSVDDLPKPSPRNKKSKGPAAASLAKLSEPKNLKEWTHATSKGMFYIDEETEKLLCHQYNLKLTEDTSVWITIQPIKTRCQADSDQVIDTGLFILRDKPDEDGNVLITFTRHRDAKGKYGVKCSLDAGNYRIIPFTTGSRLKKRESDPSSAAKLLQLKDGKYTISKAFRKVLEDIFDLSDLDGNGTMSREEFNWYNIRTSDEEVGDDEWEVVEERLELEDGEITKNGFLQLNEMEAEDSNGDEDDMWVTLESLGINKELVMDEACPFVIDVYTEDCDDAEFKVEAIEDMMDKLQRPLCQSVMEKGEATKVKGMKDLTMFTYMSDTRATIVVDNKSYSSVRLNLDCSGSRNCLTNQPSLDETFSVKSQSQIIAYHFTPKNEDDEWNVKCEESIQK